MTNTTCTVTDADRSAALDRCRGGVLRWHAWNGGVKFYCALPTVADAVEYAAQFPKSYRMHATTLTTYSDADPSRWFELGYVAMQVSFRSNGVTGERNETGARRCRQVLAKAAALGLPVEYDRPDGDSWLTEAEALDLIAE